jgi:serralysin
VRVAAADVDGDGLADIVTGAGPGGGPHVKVFSGADGSEIRSFLAYDAAFMGGVFVAAADIDLDGTPDLVTGAGAPGGPHVRVFSAVDGRELAGFFAYPAGFAGGVLVAAGG